MESPVVLDKPPEYHGNERGFPFDEDEGSGAWSELAARHPDIAARLRQRPATWARKRRPSSQDATDDFGDGFGGFDRFPFDDIPPEFREHFPTHWNRRYPRDEHPPQSPPAQCAATQTDHEPAPAPEQPAHTSHTAHPSHTAPTSHLPQYGLRNTVDLGQKSPADPSLVDADERTQRSMSAPPDAQDDQSFKMSGQNNKEQHPPPQAEQHSNVRHIPIFVEGRDEPVINKNAHFGETKPAYVPPPQQQPHIDREQYFADDSPAGFHHPQHFTRAFGTPFNKAYRQGPQPFVQQKVYPQAAYTRGTSPQRSQSPQTHPEEHFVKVPVHHEQAAPKTEAPSRPQQRPLPQQHQQPQQQQQQKHQPPPQQHQPPKQSSPQPREQSPPQPKQQAQVNDAITQILSIQTDVLNLMTDVENFKGSKNDKAYLYLDEMLTRNLIKLDNIETDGKENIRQARKEAIKCIQKCIAVLEAKAESNSAAAKQAQTQDVEMKENSESQPAEQATANGEVEMKEATKEQGQGEPPVAQSTEPPAPETKTETPDVAENAKVPEATQPEGNTASPADTRPEEKAPETTENATPAEESKTPKKTTKVVKKRNKSKDNKKEDSNKLDKVEDSNKEEKLDETKKENVETMQVDNKGDKTEAVMDVDGAASQ